eukprot:755020-Prymnesium_polylepis.1
MGFGVNKWVAAEGVVQHSRHYDNASCKIHTNFHDVTTPTPICDLARPKAKPQAQRAACHCREPKERSVRVSRDAAFSLARLRQPTDPGGGARH